MRAIAAQDASDFFKPLDETTPGLAETICTGDIVKVLVEVVEGVVGRVLNEAGTDAWLRESLPVNEASELCSRDKDFLFVGDISDRKNCSLVGCAPFGDVKIMS